MTRSINDLVRVKNPAWPYFELLASRSNNAIQIYPGELYDGLQTLYRLQMTASSMLGGIVLNCGALTVDYGWIKVLGSGAPGLPGVADANGLAQVPPEAGLDRTGMVVAVDVLGGQFAIDGGGLGVKPGEVCYWNPSTMSWVGLGAGHTSLVEWLLTGDHTNFYAGLRWDGWQDETSTLDISEGISVYPFAWSEEFHTHELSRKAVPLSEIIGLNQTSAEQMGTESPLSWHDDV